MKSKTEKRNNLRFTVLIICSLLIIFFQFFFSQKITLDFSRYMKNQRNDSMSRMVHLAHNSIKPVVERLRSEEIGKEEARTLICDRVRKMTYEDEYGPNYIFMSSYDGKMLVQPFDPEKEGSDQWKLKDANGIYIIQELIKAAKQKPEGSFVTYAYDLPDKSGVEEKLSYVMGIPEIDAYIGTGMYVESSYLELKGILERQRYGFIFLTVAILAVLIVYVRILIRGNNLLTKEINERKAVEGILKDSEKRYRALYEAANDAIIILDDAYKYVECNDKSEEIFGCSKAELNNRSPFNLSPERQPNGVLSRKLAVEKVSLALAGTPQKFEWQHIRMNGTPFYAEVSLNRVMFKDRAYVQAVIRDITERRQFIETLQSQYQDLQETQAELQQKHDELSAIHEELTATEEELRKQYDELQKSRDEARHLAYFDYLTGLPNRVFIVDDLKDKLGRCSLKGCNGSIFFIDVDNFKVINDTFGHSYGDRVLVELGNKLNTLADDDIIIGRIGGDEFIVVQDVYQEEGQIKDMAEQILNLFAKPVFIDGNNFSATCSIGVALYPGNGSTVGEILKNADMAMYKAKAKGKNKFVFYDDRMGADLSERIELEKHLREAFKNKEFELYYQPKVDTAKGDIIGFEALLRWISPIHGIVSPAKFIPVAEEIGLINDIGKWVIDESFAFAKSFSGRNLVVSCNVSSIQLMQSSFVRDVTDIHKKYDLKSGMVALEITESSLIESFEETTEKLAGLREKGILIYLDDFGTGYSSLTYLKNLPIDIVKIDKSFIDNITNDGVERRIVKTIISLAHEMGLKVVAEGVETMAQMEYLNSFKCNYIQGYLISRPVPKREVEKLL